MAPVMRNCCCCNVKTGSRVVGWIILVFAVLEIILALYGLTATEQVQEQVHNYVCQASEASYAHQSIDQLALQLDCATSGKVQEVMEVVKTVLIVDLVSFLITFVVCVLLLRGIDMKRRGFMLPFLIWEMMLFTLFAIVGIIALVAIASGAGGFQLTATIATYLCCFALWLYMWLCVLAHYQELHDPMAYVHGTFQRGQPAGVVLMQGQPGNEPLPGQGTYVLDGPPPPTTAGLPPANYPVEVDHDNPPKYSDVALANKI